MAKGYALLVGMERVDAKYYAGWEGVLEQPENDAKAMEQIARQLGFETQLLLNSKATREAVISSISEIAAQMEPEDLFFLYYSGHGGQVPDLDGDEEDEFDETWCLYNGQLIDDELHVLWGDFKENSRVIVISDSCHSGTITKALPMDNCLISKSLPEQYVMKTFNENKSFYQKIAEEVQRKGYKEIKASVHLMASSQDSQSSYAFADAKLSLFTTAFCKLWNAGNRKVVYEDMLNVIKESIKADVGRMQTPNFYVIGKENDEFNKQFVLSI